MSYCRWSSSNFQCDIYCYEYCYGGIMIHVAAQRIAEPLPQMPQFSKENIEDGTWLEAHNSNMKLLDAMERLPIGLPHDGESFHETDHKAAYERLLMLRDVGYQVPEYAIQSLLEDAQEAE